MQIARVATQKKSFEGKYAELSEKVIKVFYQVHTELGYGFSEKVYQKAFGLALRDRVSQSMSRFQSMCIITGSRLASFTQTC